MYDVVKAPLNKKDRKWRFALCGTILLFWSYNRINAFVTTVLFFKIVTFMRKF